MVVELGPTGVPDIAEGSSGFSVSREYREVIGMGLKDKMSAPRENRGEPRRNHRERGFVLITVAIAAIALISCLGLAVDVGGLFISKNEMQAFTDAAAIAGGLQIDGTNTGITAAQTAVS